MTSSKSDPIWDLPSVQLQISEASRCYGDLAAQRHQRMLQAMGPRRVYDSPLEAIFWVWWVTLESTEPDMDFGFSLHPQHEVECEGAKYRLDFAIPEYQIAVELDGHDFHERTKEQVAYRNQRDRRLQAAGWTVFHFSGLELYRGQVECVASVADLARERHKKAQGL